MKLFLVLCALVVVASASRLDDEWEAFKDKFNKTFDEYELYRKGIFAHNRALIKAHNDLATRKGLVSYTLEINQFAAMTNEEYREWVSKIRPVGPSGADQFNPSVQDIPASVDWRTKGAVTGVKDQGQCGSCWAFSAVASLEGQYFLKSKKLVSLSEQELVDCTTPEGNQGCNGGLMDQAYTGIKRLGGIESEDDYPYTAQDGTCQFDKKKVVTTVTGFKDIPTGDEKSLTNAIATVGPIAVAIDASSFQFQFYSGGVFDYSSCKNKEADLDHGVTAVGYGTDGGKDYYIVKNSWASSWGQNGYILMSRNKNNQCGIATAASYPLL